MVRMAKSLNYANDRNEFFCLRAVCASHDGTGKMFPIVRVLASCATNEKRACHQERGCTKLQKNAIWLSVLIFIVEKHVHQSLPKSLHQLTSDSPAEIPSPCCSRKGVGENLPCCMPIPHGCPNPAIAQFLVQTKNYKYRSLFF